MNSAQLLRTYDATYYLRKVEGWREFAQRRLTAKRRELLGNIDFFGKSVLDVGFGRGEVAQYCYDNGASVVGIDYSPVAWAIARKYCDPGVKLHIFSIEKLPTLRGVGPFDIVLVLDVLEHVADWEAQILAREVERRARPGCLVYVLTPADIRRGQYRGMHITQWNFRKLNALFAGFEPIEWKMGGDLYVVYRHP